MIFRFMVVFSNPIQEVDIYRYIVDGSTVVSGFDPYLTPPQKIFEALNAEELAETSSTNSDPIDDDELRIVEMINSRPGLEHALEYVHFKELTTPYPPVSQAVFALAMKTVPADANLRRYIVTMKTAVILFDLATAILVVLLLRHVGLPTPWVIAYLWCPLLVKEFANSGHLDSIVVFLMTAAILATLYALWPTGWESKPHSNQIDAPEAPATRPKTGWILTSSILLALAVGAKIFPVILFPLWCFACLKRANWWIGAAATTSLLLLTLVALWPMLRHLNTTKSFAHKIAPGVFAAPEPNQADTGIEAFAKYWEMNDFLFMVVVENLKPDEVLRLNQAPAWFVVVPNDLRNGVIDLWIDPSQLPRDQVAFWIARRLMAGILMGFTLIFCFWFWRRPTPQIWLEMVFLTIAWLWFLAPTQNPWYWTWSLPFLVFARGRTWFLVSGAVMAYYLRFYFEYHFTNTPVWGTELPGTRFFDFIVPWFEFFPILLLLFGAWTVRTISRHLKRPQQPL